MYPAPLNDLIDLFEHLPEQERRENLIVMSDAAKRHEPKEGEKFDLEDVRKDEECTDTVGVYLTAEEGDKARFAITLGPKVQTLTKAMTSILCRQVTRDYVDPEGFAQLCRKNGITPDTTVIFYGDKSNWWACYALWVFTLFGHKNLKVLDGGRAKWEEENRPLTREVPKYPETEYPVPARRDDATHRAYQQQTLEHMKAKKPMVDVRSVKEFTGETTHMPEYPQEGVLRGGHIPGAKSCPWPRAANADGTFKPRHELEAIYGGELGLKQGDDIVAYCRIGERSSHTWFVLKHLLGFTNVRNYDGSWTEWGNMVRTPIEKGGA